MWQAVVDYFLSRLALLIYLFGPNMTDWGESRDK